MEGNLALLRMGLDSLQDLRARFCCATRHCHVWDFSSDGPGSLSLSGDFR